MKRGCIALAFVLIAFGAKAEGPVTSGGLRRALADALYCQLAGCTMTGALTASSSGLIFNGTTLLTQGANITALANLANAQSWRIFNTTDSNSTPVNAEWFECSWAANIVTCQTVKAGTGTVRSFALNGSQVLLQVAGATKWIVNASGNLTPNSNNGQDFGSTALAVRTAYIATSIQGGSQKTLTESAATGFVRIDITSGSSVGGYVDYTVEANDATDFQSRSGRVAFQIVNKAGTETCVVSGYDGTAGSETKDGSSLARSDGASTLTYAHTADTTPTNGCNLQLNAVSSLTQTTLRIDYRVNITSGVATVTGL